MISLIHGPLIYKPEQWIVVFDPVAQNRVCRWLSPGRFKHVRAYGYVPFLHVWLFVDANLAGLELYVAAGGEPARAMAAEWTRGCTCVLMPRRPHANRSLVTAASGWCVPTVKRLIGLRSSALRCDALLADCLRNGGHMYGRPILTISPTDATAGANADPSAGLCGAAGPGTAAPAARPDDAGAAARLHAPAA